MQLFSVHPSRALFKKHNLKIPNFNFPDKTNNFVQAKNANMQCGSPPPSLKTKQKLKRIKGMGSNGKKKEENKVIKSVKFYFFYNLYIITNIF